MGLQSSFEFPPAARKVWSVSSLLATVKQDLDREYFEVWIEGEISNFHQAASRHCYFTLKDAQGQLKAAMFATQARHLKFRPHDGLQVLLRGRISLYEARGELQCYVEHIEPLGRGALQIAFEQLKQKLAAEGLFEPGRKRPLPKLPRRIGLVTSPRGAALADILHVLRRRYPNLDLLLYPVAVQGEAAVPEIAEALAHFRSLRPGDPLWVDLLIVARGGGSLEDLWAFNDERVARALALLPMPVISAVGHETDFTIADFVADLRAPTPSAAAELAVRPKAEFLAEVAGFTQRLAQIMRFSLLRRRHHLTGHARHRAFQALRLRLAQRAQRSDELAYALRGALNQRLQHAARRLARAEAGLRQHDVRASLGRMAARLQAQERALLTATRRQGELRRHRLDRAAALLEAHSPLGILARGYALVYNAEGHLATSARGLAPGDPLRLRFAQGSAQVQVRSVEGAAKD